MCQGLVDSEWRITRCPRATGNKGPESTGSFMLIPGRVKDSTGEGRRSKHDKLFVKAAHTEKNPSEHKAENWWQTWAQIEKPRNSPGTCSTERRWLWKNGIIGPREMTLCLKAHRVLSDNRNLMPSTHPRLGVPRPPGTPVSGAFNASGHLGHPYPSTHSYTDTHVCVHALYTDTHVCVHTLKNNQNECLKSWKSA